MGTTSGMSANFDFAQLYSQYPSQEELQQLHAPITQQELSQVTDEWPKIRTPGPGWFTSEFYQYFKELIMQDLMQVMSTVMADPQITWFPLNDWLIALIRKKDAANKPSEFRPISLLNGIQRIFSKILANRLQPHMDKLLSDTQTGFLKGRNIVQGFHYAQEIIQATTRQKKQMAVFKAFDSIEWPFLVRYLQALGFTSRWIEWIYFLVLQGRSKVFLNSVAGRDIKLKRGVWQALCHPTYSI